MATEVGKGVLKQGTDVSFNLFITGSAYQLNDRKGFFYKQTEVTHNTNTHPENKQTVVTGRPSDITKEDSNTIKLLISIYAPNAGRWRSPLVMKPSFSFFFKSHIRSLKLAQRLTVQVF